MLFPEIKKMKIQQKQLENLHSLFVKPEAKIERSVNGGFAKV